MKLLTFQARHFSWKPFSQTLDDVTDAVAEGSADDAVVVFLQAEAKDEPEEELARVFKKTLKHIKWSANKKSLKNIVLHSFTHLGGQNATPELALDFMQRMATRLENTGYTVQLTPFGYFCSWQIDVFGESMAKVWREF